MERPSQPEPRVVDGYRRDTRARLLAALVPGFVLAFVGALLLSIGVHSMHVHDPRSSYAGRATMSFAEPLVAPTRTERTLVMVGALLCLASPFVLAFSLRRAVDLDGEEFLLLRTDGLVHRAGDRALLYAWEDVETVRHDAEGDALVLVLVDGTEVHIAERFGGTATSDLVRHVADVRRKALWNMLPSQRRRADVGS